MNIIQQTRTAVLERLNEGKKKDEGFSLIELIVVVLIIGIIAAIAIPVFLNAQENARVSATEGTAANALTSATAAVASTDEDETPESAVANVQAQNPDITVELASDLYGANVADVEELCIRATHTQGDNAVSITGPSGECDETTTFGNPSGGGGD